MNTAAIPRRFSKQQLEAGERHTLFTVMVELTYRCNLDCVFCYNDRGQQGKPLSLEQYWAMLGDLQSIGVLNLILTGGEPLAHPGFFEIGNRARELGFVIRLKSNGHALNPRIARRIRSEVDPYVIDISLHGASAATHDRQTRVPGSFQRLQDNLSGLLDLGMRLKLNSALTRWNADEIEKMFDLADGLGIPLAVSTVISPKDNGDHSPFAIEATAGQKSSVYAYLTSRREKSAPASAAQDKAFAASKMDAVPGATRTVNCGAGTSSLTVDPMGNVLPCMQWRRSVGNLHDSSVTTIWNAQNARLEEIRRLNREAKQLVDLQGSKMRYLRFCPGLADMHSGNPVSLYPSIATQMKIVQEHEE